LLDIEDDMLETTWVFCSNHQFDVSLPDYSSFSTCYYPACYFPPGMIL